MPSPKNSSGSAAALASGALAAALLATGEADGLLATGVGPLGFSADGGGVGAELVFSAPVAPIERR